MNNLYDELEKLFERFAINDGADSLAIMQFALELENRYSISVVELEVEKIVNLEYLYAVINNK